LLVPTLWVLLLAPTTGKCNLNLSLDADRTQQPLSYLTGYAAAVTHVNVMQCNLNP